MIRFSRVLGSACSLLFLTVGVIDSGFAQMQANKNQDVRQIVGTGLPGDTRPHPALPDNISEEFRFPYNPFCKDQLTTFRDVSCLMRCFAQKQPEDYRLVVYLCNETPKIDDCIDAWLELEPQACQTNCCRQSV